MPRDQLIDATPPDPPRQHPRSLAELEAQVGEATLNPNTGVVRRVVARPAVDKRRVLKVGKLWRQAGLDGDRYVGASGMRQISMMRLDVAEACAAGEPIELSGDNLYVEGLDLSEANLPAGARLRIGNAVCEVTGRAHEPCAKFAARFGQAAYELTSHAHPSLKPLRLRGVLLRCVEPGEVESGDEVVVLREA